MESMNPTCIDGNWSSLSRFMMSIGVIFSSCRSISPCSKNSELTKSATRFSISHGFVMADKSQTVILIARNKERLSSFENCSMVVDGFTEFRNEPRFLWLKRCWTIKRLKGMYVLTWSKRLNQLTELHPQVLLSLDCSRRTKGWREFDFRDCWESLSTDQSDDAPLCWLSREWPMDCRSSIEMRCSFLDGPSRDRAVNYVHNLLSSS